MTPDKREIILLLKKYVNQQCTPEEVVRLDRYLKDSSDEETEQLFSSVWESKEEDQKTYEELFTEEEKEALLNRVFQSEQTMPMPLPIKKPRKIFRLRSAIVAAAACMLVLFGFLWLLEDKKADTIVSAPDVSQDMNNKTADDIDPGKEDAVLITEGGKTISLTGDHEGIIDQGVDFQVVRLSSGEIQYQGMDKDTEGRWHTVETPRGGQVNFVLPDGTKVWLNAASSVRFHSNMGQSERKLEMQGEVYYEVVKSAGKTFTVVYEGGEIEVLGTKFNVNAYDKAEVQAALLEGSVRVRTSLESVLMKPNELGVIRASGTIWRGHRNNIEDFVAWKSGYFYFDDADMEAVSQQLSRWYDIDAQVDDKSISRRITGMIARDVKLSKMIEMLEYLGLDCDYHRGTLTIKSKK